MKIATQLNALPGALKDWPQWKSVSTYSEIILINNYCQCQN
jgi:hypothetical protein